MDSVTPLTRLLSKRKEMLALQQDLDKCKTEFASKEEHFRRREESLRNKDLELQESLLLFNKFLKENEVKRRRAEQRANEEIRKKFKLEKEAQQRQLVLDRARARCQKLATLVARNERYHAYLLSVYEENSAHFDEIGSIISRFHTLRQTNSDLIRQQNSVMAKTEELQRQFLQEKKQHYNASLSLNNDIAEQSKALEERVTTVASAEDSLALQERNEIIRYRELMQILYSVSNLHERCKKVLHHKSQQQQQQQLQAQQQHAQVVHQHAIAAQKEALLSKGTNTASQQQQQSQHQSQQQQLSTGKDANSTAAVEAARAAHHAAVMHYSSVDEIREDTLSKLSDIGQYLRDFAEICESISGQPVSASASAQLSWHSQQQQQQNNASSMLTSETMRERERERGGAPNETSMQQARLTQLLQHHHINDDDHISGPSSLLSSSTALQRHASQKKTTARGRPNNAYG